MASVKYTLSKKAPQGGYLEVLIRFSAGRGIDYNARTSIYVPADKWDSVKGTLVFSTRFVTPQTQELIELRTRLEDLERYIMAEYMHAPDKATSRDWLTDTIYYYHHPAERGGHTPLSKLIPEYITASNVSTGTARQYAVIQRMLERFGESEYIIYANSVTANDLEAFAHYLEREVRVTRGRGTTAVERGVNTIASKLKKLRAVCVWATQRGDMQTNPFTGFKIPAENYGSVVWLKLEERDKIASFEDLTPALKIQRDIFIFQCHIGCRVSDLTTFTHSSIVQEDNGYFLQYIQVKLRRTNPKTIRVPLDNVALELVQKYADADPVRLFPFISDVKYNVAIKAILKRAGIDRQVLVQNPRTLTPEAKPLYEVASSHLARKTFAANLFKLTKSERLVSSMTGHTPGSTAFARYSEVDDDMKRDILDSLGKEK